MLVKLVDGGIVNITDDKDSYGGCDTCDYGSRYTNYYDVELDKYKVHIEVCQMYDYALNDGDMMQIILPNIDEIKTFTEMGFITWLKEKLLDLIDEDILEYEVKDK